MPVRALIVIITAFVLSGCMADGGWLSRSTAGDLVRWGLELDETEVVWCCDVDMRIESPVSDLVHPEGQPYRVQVGFVWQRNNPKNALLAAALVSSDGWHVLDKLVVEVDGVRTTHRPARQHTLWEGNDVFDRSCIPPACVLTQKEFRSLRFFPASLDRVRQINESDRARLILYAGKRPYFGYLSKRDDVASHRRHLSYWNNHVQTWVVREPD